MELLGKKSSIPPFAASATCMGEIINFPIKSVGPLASKYIAHSRSCYDNPGLPFGNLVLPLDNLVLPFENHEMSEMTGFEYDYE